MTKIEQFLYRWNPEPPPHLHSVKIEDDSLRDGLQGAFVRQPSIEQKKELLTRSSAVGTQAAMLGFPASSQAEFDSCRELIRHIEKEALPVTPRFLARPLIRDLEPIVKLDRDSSVDVWADFLLNPSPLRAYVEGWDFETMLQTGSEAGKFLRQQKTRFGVSIEDATRTPPNRLQLAIETAISCGAEVLVICDTVGAATPEGAARLVTFVSGCAADSGVEIWWHGHNDMGLSLANAIAAAEAGANCISGSFLGIGERTGNTPLEQLLIYLYQCGHRGFDISQIASYCRQLAAYTETPIPPNTPLVGEQAFATCTGTHAAAIAKARTFGKEFEDLIFSSVPATDLGRQQTILLGPTSGSTNARLVLSEAGIEPNEANVAKILRLAHSLHTWLDRDRVRAEFCL
jgi:2-isopropylmalate synthase